MKKRYVGLGLLLTASACGDPGSSNGGAGATAGSGAGTSPSSTAGGGSVATAGGAGPTAGGAAPTAGGGQTVSGGSGQATTGGTGGTGGTGTAGGQSTSGAGGSSSAGGGAGPVIGGPAPPPITIDEYLAPTPSQPGFIAYGPDGNVWFTHQSTKPSAVSKLDKSGMPFSLYTVNVTNIGPRGISPGPDGNVWYTKQGGIGQMQPSGTFTEFGVPNGGDSAGICLGPDSALWFTQQLHNKVSRVGTDKQFKDFTVPTANSAPLAIVAGKDGNLWFTEAGVGANKIGQLSTAGAFKEFAIPTPASNPTGIAMGPDGNLWFTEHDARKIGKITPMGEVTEFLIPSGNTPGRIATGADGNLWFTEAGAANSIGRITPLGQVSEYPVPSKASDPYDIVAGADGNLWFTELSSNKVGRISNLKGGGTLMASNGMGGGGGDLGGDTACKKDTDCKDSGQACGGDVCSTDKKLCVLAVSTDKGTCVADTDCWCKSEGATCSAGHCSFTVHGGTP